MEASFLALFSLLMLAFTGRELFRKGGLVLVTLIFSCCSQQNRILLAFIGQRVLATSRTNVIKKSLNPVFEETPDKLQCSFGSRVLRGLACFCLSVSSRINNYNAQEWQQTLEDFPRHAVKHCKYGAYARDQLWKNVCITGRKTHNIQHTERSEDWLAAGERENYLGRRSKERILSS